MALFYLFCSFYLCIVVFVLGSLGQVLIKFNQFWGSSTR